MSKPFIVLLEEREKWLGQLDKQEITDMMRPCPDGLLLAHTVSKAISRRGVETSVPDIQDHFYYDETPMLGCFIKNYSLSYETIQIY